MTQTLEERAETIAMGRMKLGPIGEFVPVPYDEIRDLALEHLRAVERAATKAAYERAACLLKEKAALDFGPDGLTKKEALLALAEVLRALADGAAMDGRDNRQWVVLDWARRCFTNAPVDDAHERALRFIEEAAELTQAIGLPIEHVNRVVDHVYGKPVGELQREVGGVGVTLLALCEVLKLSADECEKKEIARVLQFDEEHFRRRHQAKIDAGLAVDAAKDGQDCPAWEKREDG